GARAELSARRFLVEEIGQSICSSRNCPQETDEPFQTTYAGRLNPLVGERAKSLRFCFCMPVCLTLKSQLKRSPMGLGLNHCFSPLQPGRQGQEVLLCTAAASLLIC